MRRKKALMRRYKQKTAADKQNASCSNEGAGRIEERHASPEVQNILDKVKTPDPSDEKELSLSPELSEGTPEPIIPPKIIRPMRMKLLPPSNKQRMHPFGGRTVRMKKLASTARNRDLETPPVPATRGRTCATKTRYVVPPRRAQSAGSCSSRDIVPSLVPRTRILVTPERFTPPGLPSRIILRPFKRKSTSRKRRQMLTKLKIPVKIRRSLTFDSDDASVGAGEGNSSSDISSSSTGSRRSGQGGYSADGDSNSDTSDDGSSSGNSSSSKRLPQFKLIKLAQLYILVFFIACNHYMKYH